MRSRGSNLPSFIRKEIEETEKTMKHYLDRANLMDGMGWEEMFRKYRNAYNHFSGRRSFFLKELLKVQLKEFNRD